jgi:hypothetical protein
MLMTNDDTLSWGMNISIGSQEPSRVLRQLGEVVCMTFFVVGITVPNINGTTAECKTIVTALSPVGAMRHFSYKSKLSQWNAVRSCCGSITTSIDDREAHNREGKILIVGSPFNFIPLILSVSQSVIVAVSHRRRSCPDGPPGHGRSGIARRVAGDLLLRAAHGRARRSYAASPAIGFFFSIEKQSDSTVDCAAPQSGGPATTQAERGWHWYGAVR